MHLQPTVTAANRFGNLLQPPLSNRLWGPPLGSLPFQCIPPPPPRPLALPNTCSALASPLFPPAETLNLPHTIACACSCSGLRHPQSDRRGLQQLLHDARCRVLPRVRRGVLGQPHRIVRGQWPMDVRRHVHSRCLHCPALSDPPPPTHPPLAQPTKGKEREVERER